MTLDNYLDLLILLEDLKKDTSNERVKRAINYLQKTLATHQPLEETDDAS